MKNENFFSLLPYSSSTLQLLFCNTEMNLSAAKWTTTQDILGLGWLWTVDCVAHTLYTPNSTLTTAPSQNFIFNLGQNVTVVVVHSTPKKLVWWWLCWFWYMCCMENGTFSSSPVRETHFGLSVSCRVTSYPQSYPLSNSLSFFSFTCVVCKCSRTATALLSCPPTVMTT